jgi:ribosomal protein S27AE
MSDLQLGLVIALSFVVCAGVAFAAWRLWNGTSNQAEREHWACTRCGSIAAPEYYRSGSVLITLVLLAIGILPGLIYYLWTRSHSHWGCGQCGSDELVPSDSPQAKQLGFAG